MAGDYSGGMTPPAFVIFAALLLASCTKVTQENFAKVQDGMSEEAVRAILGTPTDVSSDAVITVRFVNGKAALRSFDKPSAEAKK